MYIYTHTYTCATYSLYIHMLVNRCSPTKVPISLYGLKYFYLQLYIFGITLVFLFYSLHILGPIELFQTLLSIPGIIRSEPISTKLQAIMINSDFLTFLLCFIRSEPISTKCHTGEPPHFFRNHRVSICFCHFEVQDHYVGIGHHLLVQDAPSFIQKYLKATPLPSAPF
jgi:hypothetical protein